MRPKLVKKKELQAQVKIKVPYKKMYKRIKYIENIDYFKGIIYRENKILRFRKFLEKFAKRLFLFLQNFFIFLIHETKL